jgi:hypothetical protein
MSSTAPGLSLHLDFLLILSLCLCTFGCFGIHSSRGFGFQHSPSSASQGHSAPQCLQAGVEQYLSEGISKVIFNGAVTNLEGPVPHMGQYEMVA